MERKYLIIAATEIKKVDFSKILENAPATLSFSADGKRTFIKWVGDEPEFVNNIKIKEGPYGHQELLEIIRGDEWNYPSKKKTTKKLHK